jgi:hypothetical protein
MTYWSKYTYPLHMKFFFEKESFNSILIKIEVITDSNLIVNSVRILIVALALLLAFTQNSDKDVGRLDLKNKELIENSQ